MRTSRSWSPRVPSEPEQDQILDCLQSLGLVSGSDIAATTRLRAMNRAHRQVRVADSWALRTESLRRIEAELRLADAYRQLDAMLAGSPRVLALVRQQRAKQMSGHK